MCGLRVGAAAENELSWQDYSAPKGLSADGEYLLFHETGDGGGRNYSVYVWHLGESAPTRLGEGRALALSPDGRWALVMDESSDRLTCMPTGIGSPRPLECGQLHQHGFASFSPDGARILFAAQENGEATRCYVLDLASQRVHSVTPPGTTLIMGESPIEPTGKRFATSSPERALSFYAFAGDSDPEPLPGALAGERVMAWDPEGNHAWVRQPAELPARVFRLDLRSGSRELWRELAPNDIAGVAAVDIVCVAPAARAYVYSYVRTLSDLYLVEGVA
jgi:dipeptidyl aminopeptidase/acylaminoacyl peptidase